MTSFSSTVRSGGDAALGACPTDADRALLLAFAAWGDGRRGPGDGRQGVDTGEFIERSREWLGAALVEPVRDAWNQGSHSRASSDQGRALDELRNVHQATVRVDLSRVHPTWMVRALREESPAVRRLVAASLPASLRHPVQAGLLLDSQDLVSERPAAPEVARWALALWSERLVGGEAQRADDPPAIIVLGRMSGRAGYRLCQLAGLCKLVLAGHGPGDRARPGIQARWEWLGGRLAAADQALRTTATHDVKTSQSSGVPARHQAARIGLTTLARLLAVAEPFRLRWALQHWPYPIAKLIRSLMPPATSRPPELSQGETLILQTAWDRLNLEGRLVKG